MGAEFENQKHHLRHEQHDNMVHMDSLVPATQWHPHLEPERIQPNGNFISRKQKSYGYNVYKLYKEEEAPPLYLLKDSVQ